MTPLSTSDLGDLYRRAIVAAVAGDLAAAEAAEREAHALWRATWSGLGDDDYERALGWGEAAQIAVAACRARVGRAA